MFQPQEKQQLHTSLNFVSALLYIYNVHLDYNMRSGCVATIMKTRLGELKATTREVSGVFTLYYIFEQAMIDDSCSDLYCGKLRQ